jgi:hypothetical protein
LVKQYENYLITIKLIVMKNLLLTLFLATFTFVCHAAMLVCYGNEDNCFGSNGNCEDLEIECSTDGSYDPGGCNCTQISSAFVIDTYDENLYVRRFRIVGDHIQIENAEGTSWTSFYDLALIDTDKLFQLKYVSSLNRIVLSTY